MTNINPMAVPWYAVVNDVIGGWAICNVDKPCSQQSINPEDGEIEIADFIQEDVARYIVRLHNERLAGASREPAEVVADPKLLSPIAPNWPLAKEPARAEGGLRGNDDWIPDDGRTPLG